MRTHPSHHRERSHTGKDGVHRTLTLKQTGARWRVKRLERMAALCCLWYSDQFDAYWKKAAG